MLLQLKEKAVSSLQLSGLMYLCKLNKENEGGKKVLTNGRYSLFLGQLMLL